MVIGAAQGLRITARPASLEWLFYYLRMIHPRALLYHSVYGRIPSALDGLIHNVDPETFRRQMAWCKERFEFVSADDLFSSPRAGSLCITFDDANESVLSIALPILESLKIPATIFINGVSLLGRPLWRDKIRWLIKNRMVRDFLEGNPSYSALLPSDSERFFAATKSPRVNSARLDRDLDAFLAAKGISESDLFNPALSQATLPQHEGVVYGDHGFNHYVLTSLTREEREREIDANQALIRSLVARPSRIFAVPFGHASHHDALTRSLLRERGYLGLFADLPDPVDPFTGMPVADEEPLPCISRIKAPADLDGLVKRLLEPGPAAHAGKPVLRGQLQASTRPAS
jgi:peptidoglycan/xylan/chitin deacetylase (PgdA/CDA1 family)